jgi:hypothetical protein
MKHNRLAPKRIIRLDEALRGCIGSLNHVRKVARSQVRAEIIGAPPIVLGIADWVPFMYPTKFASGVESLSGPRPIGSVSLAGGVSRKWIKARAASVKALARLPAHSISA